MRPNLKAGDSSDSDRKPSGLPVALPRRAAGRCAAARSYSSVGRLGQGHAHRRPWQRTEKDLNGGPRPREATVVTEVRDTLGLGTASESLASHGVRLV